MKFPEYFDDKYPVKKSHTKNQSEQQTRNSKAIEKSNIENSGIDNVYFPAFEYTCSINGFKLISGNQAELLPDAAKARSRLLEDIDSATSEVHVLYYVWLNDETGNNVGQALIRAVKRGVICRAMADALGSPVMIKSNLWKEMKQAGVQLSVALPFNNIIRTLIESRIDLRNHRKISVIDGKVSYCGSQNCADPEFRVKLRYAPWVDILLRFEGPVVAQYQLLFISDWLLNNKNSLDDFMFKPMQNNKGFPAVVWGDGPTERNSATPHLFATLITLAKQQIVISTPYFVPNETVLKALSAAAFRGVEVSIIFPAINDSWVVGAASRSYYRELLETGINIYEFNGGLLHSKTLTIDGVISLIGSSNIDIRSFNLNYENNILLSDKNTTEDILQRQYDYIKSATQVNLTMVDEWSFPKRIWNNVVATVGPIL